MGVLLSSLALMQRLTLWLAALALFVLPIITFYDVVMRYIFISPTIWVTEISLYLLKFLVFTTAGALVIDGSHLRVAFLIERLTGRAKYALELFTTLAIFPYALVLIWYGWYYVERALAQGSVSATLLQTPMWIIYSLIPIGGGLLALSVVAKSMLLTKSLLSEKEGA